MTTWKNSGETRANSCRKNDATSTSLRRCRYLWIAPMKPGDVEAARDLRQSGPAGHQDQSAVPDREKLGPRHQGGPGRQRRLDQNLVFGSLGDHQKPAIAQGRDGGQGRLGKPRPVGPVGSRLEPEILGAPEHLRCANLVCSQPMPDLSAISRNTLEMQQRHEGFEPRIGWCSRCRLRCSLAFSGARCRLKRAAASATAAGLTVDRQSALHRGHRPPRRSSMPCAGPAGRDSRRASHRLPSRCRRCCCCSPRRL